MFLVEKKKYLLFGKERLYCLVENIQEFMSTSIESRERLEEIIEICVNKYPQILGFEKDQGV